MRPVLIVLVVLVVGFALGVKYPGIVTRFLPAPAA